VKICVISGLKPAYYNRDEKLNHRGTESTEIEYGEAITNWDLSAEDFSSVSSVPLWCAS
jgi:hypothetical protein